MYLWTSLLRNYNQKFSYGGRKKYLPCHQLCLASYILARTVLAQDKISLLHLLELNLLVILIYKKQSPFSILIIKNKWNPPVGMALMFGIRAGMALLFLHLPRL